MTSESSTRRSRPEPWDPDRAVAAVALVALVPVLAAVALVVRACLGPPVLFRQVRAGRHGKPFTILKFRTMQMADSRCCENPAACIGLQMPPGVTTPGLIGLVRRLGLDELPQLVNIARGDMRFVGPRPLMPRYVGRYTPAQARRLEVLPGITGWAQVSGRTDLPWEDRLDLDAWYVDRRSARLDLRIALLTLRAALGGRGYSQSGSSTGYEFLGTGVAPGVCPARETGLGGLR